MFYYVRRRSIKVTVVLLPLLGITWVFGFMAVDESTIFFHYIFAIANSLQVEIHRSQFDSASLSIAHL